MAGFNLKQPANDFLADCVNNLTNLLREGKEPAMDLELFGVTFEFRIKPKQVMFYPKTTNKNKEEYVGDKN